MTPETRSDRAINALRQSDTAPATLPGEAAVQKAIDKALGNNAVPVFHTHSQGLAGMLAAQARTTREKMADVRAKIAELEAEYTDLMRVESAITKASDALVIDIASAP